MELHNRSYNTPTDPTIYPSLKHANSAPGRLEGVAQRTSGVWVTRRVSDSAVRRSVSLPSSPVGNRPSSVEYRAIGVNRKVQLQDADGQDIKAIHTYKSETLGMEVAIRVPGHKALSVVLEQAHRQLYRKKQELEGLPPTPERQKELAEVNGKIKANAQQRQNLIDDSTASKRRFFDSNYHRDFMKSALAGKTLNGSTYEEIASRTSPGLVNARAIKLLKPDGEQGLLRLGVMSDLTNGATNLRELKEIKNGNATLQGSAVASLLERMKGYPVGSPAHASLQMAVKQLSEPEKTYEMRKGRMTLQMLQYLAVQAERVDPSKIQGDTWNVVDVRLLTPSKDEMDVESGWLHNETNELLDMQEIFKEFNGKTVVLDGRGPFVDDDGKVHLPIDGEGKELKLNAALLNISIQGDSSKNEVQQQVNQEAIAQLENHEALQQDDNWKGMLELLKKGESNGTVAEMAVTALVKSGCTVSVGCLSAKDRTGWVVGRTVIKLMADDRPEVRKFLTSKLIGAGSVASQVLKDVTGWRFMKLDYKTMGSDATLSVKARHTIGLVGEWSVNFIKKKLSGFTKEPPPITDRQVSQIR
ncbi:MAG: hypothetical protein JSS12_04200 [Verrucomicrobia bacterium]|nr:hypothetical protein [Verrucomicrobiota bacterium]